MKFFITAFASAAIVSALPAVHKEERSPSSPITDIQILNYALVRVGDASRISPSRVL
jgi:hypothetical protein